jgi:hypothetical protein
MHLQIYPLIILAAIATCALQQADNPSKDAVIKARNHFDLGNSGNIINFCSIPMEQCSCGWSRCLMPSGHIRCCEPDKTSCIPSGEQKGICCPTSKTSKTLTGGRLTCCNYNSQKICKRDSDCTGGDQCDENGCCGIILL